MLNSYLKYAECTYKRKLYINISQKFLDKTYKEYKAKVDTDKKLLTEVILQLLRNKKILEQANKRAQSKAICLALKIETDKENILAENINCPAALVGIEFSSAIQSTIAIINAAIASHSTT